MRRFKNVLVVAAGQDGDSAAAHRAVWLARANNAELHGLAAVDAPSWMPWKGGSEAEHQQLVEQRRKGLLAHLDDASGGGLDVDVAVQVDRHPAIAIIQRVLLRGHDIIVMGGAAARSSEAMPKWFSDVVRKAPVPVWVTNASTRSEHIAIAVSLEDDESKQALDLKLVEMGTTLAREDRAKVSFVNVWRVPGESMMRSPVGGDDQDEVDRLVLVEEDQARTRMDALLAKVDTAGLDHEVRMLHGIAAPRLTRFVADNGVDLLVMGTLGRAGITGAVVGNTADAVLRDSVGAVLAVKPPGFVSPVSPPV